MNETTITRRTALRTTVLSVIGAGLMAAAGTRPEPAHAEPVANIDRAEALLLEVERIMMGLDELARADLGFELDRLGSLAVAADPAAFVAEHERGTGANRLSAADPIELDRPDDRAFHGPVGRPAGPILLAARHCTEWTRPRRTVRNQCPRQVGWMHERPRPREGEWLMSIAVATPPGATARRRSSPL